MKLSRLLLLGVLLVFVSMLAVPVAAQDDDEGGIIVFSTFGTSPGTLNPIYCTDTACSGIIQFMNIGMIGADPSTATFEPGQPDNLALDWDVSDDNLTYTFYLREDMFWSDGTQVTTADLIWMWENITTNPEANYSLAFRADDIEEVNVIDDFTIEVVMVSPNCTAMPAISGALTGRGRVVPSHIFSQFEIEDLPNIAYSTNPDPIAGPFSFGDFRPDEQTTVLSRGADYVDAFGGSVSPEGIIQVVLPDQTVQVEEFLASGGEVNILDFVPPHRRNDARAAQEAGTHQLYEFPGNVWDYMAFNLADPDNPQPALDDDGNRIDQGLHPLFSDRLVRNAIGYAVDVDAIVEGAVFGEGSRMPAQITTSSWAVHPDLEPRPHDPDRALELLAEAGWVLNDAGRLVCDDCLYAREVDADFNGSEFQFELLTNAGNARREAIGTIIQDELDRIGITVDFQTIDFNLLLDIMDGQTYDAFILGWQAAYPDDPDTVNLFGAEADVPGSGFNFTSFYNEEFFELEREALMMPGCDPEDRAPIYHRMQEIMYEEMPYLWLFSQDGMYGARANVSGFDPYPAQLWWNVTEWTVADR
jgi:peptide/nickel transport system substrate-binding protein